MKIAQINSEQKKELLKNLAVIFICIICSTTLSLFIINPKLSGNAAVIKNNIAQKSEITSGVEKNLFSDTEIIADIVEEIQPSVVHITTEIEQKLIQDPRQYFFEDEFFKRFFGHDQNEFQTPRLPLSGKTAGTGSGTIISSDGYILTNYHVVQNASKIVVKTKDGKEYEAKLIGKDKYSDLAVIKINEKNLKPAKLSDSSKIRPGQWAIAVGSPQGLEHTVTLGIISAIRRDIPELSNVSFIQTDAAINPGNSGGPLLNIKGEVVGINTAIMGTAQNIGFAIPVNTAKKIVDQLKSGETIGHAWLGIAMSPVTPEIAKALDISKDTKGVVITKIIRESPADNGGLQPGDIIQRIDGKKFDDPKMVQEEIKNKEVNDKINIQILREGKLMAIEIKLGNWGDSAAE
ncbi:MAG TPA: trypsin-like peptidase domain-containing protein [Candidatus Gastranaerophilales bacterium]|nr:trypsin-like peptidase domain-containing protein [Candidatus Gastranaerophilales bacterium]